MDLFDDLPFDDEFETAPVAARPLSISELTAQLKHLVEHGFSSVAVEGEISNCRQWSSGHLYFTLKDDYAQIRAVMFRKTAHAWSRVDA
jgi:exodeoxyribonuclease VII large subunit